MVRIYLILCISILAYIAKGQTSTNSGAWTVGANWSTGTAPNTGGLSANIIINRAMTFNSNSITGWGSTTITITAGGSLTVTGNFSLTGSGANVIVQSGGSLTVSGTTTVTNGARLTIAGGATPGSATFNALSATSNGVVTINAGASVTAASLTTSSNNNAIINNLGSLTITGNVSSSGVITNSGTMQVNGNFTQNNSGNSATNSGNLTIQGNATALGLIQLNPGASSSSTAIINGTLTVNANPWIVVGNNVSACNSVITNYANLVVRSNLILTGSGDVTVNQNGRMAVFGDIVRAAGGSGNLISISCGGQVYVDGNIDLGTGGGNTVTNSNNAGSPTGSNGSPVIGLYVNGTTTAQSVAGSVGNQNDLLENNSAFADWIGSIPSSPLPITLVYFAVKSVNTSGVVLVWETSMEKDFDYFLVERAGEDLEFKSIATIQGKGGLEVLTTYNYLDNNPLSGKNYYRLRSVDIDQTYEYSNTVFAQWHSNQTTSRFLVYPNPVANYVFTVKSTDDLSSDTHMILFNSTGTEILRQTMQSNEEMVTLQPNIAAGIYYLRIFGTDTAQVIRIMIL